MHAFIPLFQSPMFLGRSTCDPIQLICTAGAECSLNVPWMFHKCSLNVPWRCAPHCVTACASRKQPTPPTLEVNYSMYFRNSCVRLEGRMTYPFSYSSLNCFLIGLLQGTSTGICSCSGATPVPWHRYDLQARFPEHSLNVPWMFPACSLNFP
jgi:hypothetical protein